jgi:hypothetical protein
MLTILASIHSQVALSDESANELRRELTDVELHSITAGSDAARSEDDLVVFGASKTTAAGTRVDVDGSFGLVEALDASVLGSLQLSDNAQRDLSSLINIIAVNSDINVLMNLNINVDSNIGQLTQYNLQGISPNQLIRPGQ